MRNRIMLGLVSIFMIAGLGTLAAPAHASVTDTPSPTSSAAPAIAQAAGNGDQDYAVVGTLDFYVNATGGGPAVEVYTQQSRNNDFTVERYNAYYQLAFTPNTGNGYDGDCISDYGNSEGSARAGLVVCQPNDVGWGANFVRQTCSGGFEWQNVHWGGYLDYNNDNNYWYLNGSSVCIKVRAAY